MSEEPQGGFGQSWFVLDFEAAYAGEATPPVVEPDAGGGSQSGFFGPIGHRVEFRVPLASTLLRRVTLVAKIRQQAVRKVSFSVPTTVHGARHVEHRVELVREQAHMYSQALREDDELLAVLLAAR